MKVEWQCHKAGKQRQSYAQARIRRTKVGTFPDYQEDKNNQLPLTTVGNAKMAVYVNS